jgi:hypothetical protein
MWGVTSDLRKHPAETRRPVGVVLATSSGGEGRASPGGEIAQNLGDWFAEHNSWLSESRLRRADAVRISQLLGQIESGLSRGDELSPESGKIMSEIDRWHKSVAPLTQKLVLKRGPETAEVAVEETIADFGRALQRITSLFADYSGPRQHLLSVLTDSLRSAAEQKNEEALLLSALMIYYLKQYGYKIEPYVRKLKEAERTIKTGHRYAEPV